MFEPRTVAALYGITVELTDLGAWDGTTLISEYDACTRAIRINERALDKYRRECCEPSSCDVRAFIDLAIAHELYHHREAIGEIPRLATRAQREEAADAYARANVCLDARLAAFLQTKVVA